MAPKRAQTDRLAKSTSKTPGNYSGASKLQTTKSTKNATGGSNSGPAKASKGKGKGRGKAKETGEESEERVEESKRSPSARLSMLGKDRNRFKKIQAQHDKTLAASIRADAESGDESEEEGGEEEEEVENDDDDDVEPTQETPVEPAKRATKKSARERSTTAARNSATRTSASPTIQNGTIVKVRRKHRKVRYGYRSAPSDSEWEEKRKVMNETGGTKTTLAKLRETINRHARYCPFVRINKKLHHAHRRIRAMQDRSFSEAELSQDDDPGAGHNNYRIHEEDSDDEDGDDDDQHNQPDVTNEDETSAPQKKKDARKPKAPAAKKPAAKPKSATAKPSTRKTKPSKTPAADSEQAAARVEASDVPDMENSPSNIEDNDTAGATDKNAPASKAAGSKDEVSKETPRSSGEKLEAKHNASLKPQQDRDSELPDTLVTKSHENERGVQPVKQTATTKTVTVKKRNASDAELTPGGEVTSKNRKIGAD